MGVFEVVVQIANPFSPNRVLSLQVLVDTGATLTSLPRILLESIGVIPGMRRTFVLADGRKVERETGAVVATLNGVTMPIPVMFAESDDAAVLGATALEILGFAVDPVEKKLVPRDLLALWSGKSELSTWAKPTFNFEAGFVSSLRELPKVIHSKLVKCLDLFLKDRRHPGLNVESLSGRAQGLYSARIDLGYRLIFCETAENEVCLLFVGKEEEAYRYADSMGPHWQLARREARPPVVSIEPSALSQLVSLKTRKYLPLSHFLAQQPPSKNRVEVSFADVARIVRESLPDSAYKYPAWWANERGRHVQASAWLAVGWKSTDVHLKEQRVSFVRLT